LEKKMGGADEAVTDHPKLDLGRTRRPVIAGWTDRIG
jgi:hypothetical protein